VTRDGWTQEKDGSPADRYASAWMAGVTGRRHPRLAEFAVTRPFPLDPFQLEACRALEDGRGVLVCAPTGAGKTVVGEFAVHLALASGGKCFYTTPIKALSNQKYTDLIAQYGPDRVGLLTGDTSVNSHAPIVVMTTEVLRNMLYAGSPDLGGLTHVVLDEIHYLADKFRGPVWEEVILHVAFDVAVVGLSATVSNAEEFGAWLAEVRGELAVVVDEVRPVPLWQHLMVGRRLFDLFGVGDSGFDAAHPDAADPDAGGSTAWRIDPSLTRAIRDAEALADRYGGRPGRRGERGRPGGPGSPRWRPPNRVDVIERLDGAGLLPAITFIFSRAGCDAAVVQCVRAGLRLTTEKERDEIRQIVDRRTAELMDADLGVLGYWEWRDGLERGVAAHHAGLLPVFKETVEELFVAGLVKAVFATETLALGINMPARTVVLEKLVKYNGESHADLTAGEYTQLTGRAGRRGIDVEGHAVVLWSPGMDPRMVAGLASRRTYPLRSSFRPSYNMAVNLVDRLGRDAARELIEQSFAQYQANGAVVGMARQVARNTEAITSHEKAMQCHLGSTAEYLDLLTELAVAEREIARSGAARRRDATAHDLAELRRGDVIDVPAGRRSGLAVVLDPGIEPDGSPRPLVVTSGRWAGRLSAADFRGPVPALGRVKLGKFTDHRSPKIRRDIASAIASSGIRSPGRGRRSARREESASTQEMELTVLRRVIRAHPVHGCADREQHLQWARRWRRLTAENETLAAKVAAATGSLGQALDKIIRLLEDEGYLRDDSLTNDGRMLARIWCECDLVVAECLRRGTWVGASPAGLAAAVSCLVFESRRDGPPATRVPVGEAGDLVTATVGVWTRIAAAEREIGLPATRDVDPAFAATVAAWSRGASLAETLAVAVSGGTDISAGDFVRWCRQVVDLLDQVAGVAPPEVAAVARSAVGSLRRGVVFLGAA
jgi:ATP-dependent RNA helicase HelY